MPRNPQRDCYGGDVSGTEKISMDGAVDVSPSFEVSSASYDPGYLGVEEALKNTKRSGYVTDADIKRGYTSYGESVGESSKNWSKIR